MQRRILILFCCSGLLVTALPGHAQTITSTPCGWVRQGAPAQAETRIGPALEREPAWEAAVTGVAGNNGTTLLLDALPDVEPDALAPSQEGAWLVRFSSGALEGRGYRVIGSGVDFVTLDAPAEELATVVSGDLVEVVPYWTLGALLPPEAVGVAFTASASSLVRQTEVLFHDPARSGVNRAPVASYYFLNGAWRKVGAPASQSFNGALISPGSYVIVRNKAVATTVTYCGMVHPGARAFSLPGDPVARRDHYLSLPHPVGVTLRESGLYESGGFAASPSSLLRRDELLLFDPAQTGINQAPATTYYYHNGGWRRLGAPLTTDFSDTVELPPGGGFVLRKASGASEQTWTFLPNP